MPAKGAAMISENSRMRMPASGPAIVLPPREGMRDGRVRLV